MKSTVQSYARLAIPVLRMAADPEVRRQARAAFDWAQGSAATASDATAAKARASLDDLLGKAGYERPQPTTGAAFERAGWLSAGAALASAAYLGTQLEGETMEKAAAWIRTTFDEVGTEARAVAGAAGQTVSDASSRTLDDVLNALALQRREPASAVALRTAGWIGLGFVAGAGTFALLNSGVLGIGGATAKTAGAAGEATVQKPAGGTEAEPKGATKSKQAKTAEPGATAKAAAKPSAAKPAAAKKTPAKPSTAKPSTAKPSAAKPSAAKPSAAKPSAAKPTTPKQAAA